MRMKNETIDVLKLEYTIICNKVIFFNEQANKYVSHILTAIGVMAAMLALLSQDGFTPQENSLLFSFLILCSAVIIGLLILMALHYLVQCYRLGGYASYLEKRINLLLKSEIVGWESKVASKYIHRAVSSALIYGVVSLLFLVMVIFASYVAIRQFFSVWPVVTVIAICVLVLEFLTSVVFTYMICTVHSKTSDLFLKKECVRIYATPKVKIGRK